MRRGNPPRRCGARRGAHVARRGRGGRVRRHWNGSIHLEKLDENTVLYSHSPLSHHIATVAIEQSLVAGFEVVVNDPPQGLKPYDWIVESGANTNCTRLFSSFRTLPAVFLHSRVLEV